jgi:hypothetical protein
MLSMTDNSGLRLKIELGEEDHARHMQGAHVKTLISRFEGILAAERPRSYP